MASVGAVSYWSVSGRPSPAGERTRLVTRPGVDGTSLQKLGKKGQTYFRRAVAHLLNAAAVKALIESAKDQESEVVTIVDDLGNSWPNVAILNAEPQPVTPLVNAVGGQVANAKFEQVIVYECLDVG